mgnify:FL=1
MKDIISNNWYKFYKSLAVLLPLLATIIIAVADYYTAQNLIPTSMLPVVVGVTSILGWVIKQPSLRG